MIKITVTGESLEMVGAELRRVGTRILENAPEVEEPVEMETQKKKPGPKPKSTDEKKKAAAAKKKKDAGNDDDDDLGLGDDPPDDISMEDVRRLAAQLLGDDKENKKLVVDILKAHGGTAKIPKMDEANYGAVYMALQESIEDLGL